MIVLGCVHSDAGYNLEMLRIVALVNGAERDVCCRQCSATNTTVVINEQMIDRIT